MSPYMPAMPAVGGLDHSQGKWFAPGKALPPGYVITTHREGHTASQEGHAMSEMANESFVIPASSAAAAVKTGSAVKSKKSKKRNECMVPKEELLALLTLLRSSSTSTLMGVLHAASASMFVKKNTGHIFTKVYDERTLVFTKFLSKCMGAGQPIPLEGLMPPPPGLGFEILSLLIHGVPCLFASLGCCCK